MKICKKCCGKSNREIIDRDENMRKKNKYIDFEGDYYDT
ncbi:hypothetical protein QEW_4422 [Clostridioides difficile CD160]|nr:hypothetical protein QEW_4422 [Clostridioides difficile CD160]